MQQCLPENLVPLLSLSPDASQSKQEADEADAGNNIRLKTNSTPRYQLGTIQNVNAERLLPEENLASIRTVAGAGMVRSRAHKTPLKQHGVTSYSDTSQGTKERTEQEQVKETGLSANNLFNLDEDEIQSLRHGSFIYSKTYVWKN